jgi:hypothetical protein
MNATITIGRFSCDGKTLTGPAAYMETRGDQFLDDLLSGRRGQWALRFAPDPIRGVLVALQTDYAAWLGMQRTVAAMGQGR